MGQDRHPRARAATAAAAHLLAATLLAGCGDAGHGRDPGTGMAGDDGVKLSVLPGNPTVWTDRGFGSTFNRVDPETDGWTTEVFQELAKVRLKAVVHELLHPDEGGAGGLAEFIVEDFVCGPLRPRSLAAVHSDRSANGLTILRSREEAEGTLQPESPAYRGAPGLARALAELAAPLKTGADLRVAFKIYRVELDESKATTAALYQTYGAGSVHQTATWTCLWSFASGDESPRLMAITVTDFEEIARGPGTSPLFSDCTGSILGGDEAFREGFVNGVNYWGRSLDRRLGSSLLGHQGIALGDVDGDGLDDLFACQIGGLPNRLFVRNDDGTARDVSAAAGVDHLDDSRSALFCDFDGDGDQDLVLVSEQLIVFANDGTGRFTQAAILSNKKGTSVAAADYDNDGDLDLYFCRYSARYPGIPDPYHDANNGAANALFRNEGGLQFQDVTAEVGLDRNNLRFSFSAAWEDYDNDGDQDLYVANDFGRNNLYRNDGGHFVDVSATAGVEDISAGMSASWGDYDGDGWMDLYVSNMFSSAGNRVSYQRRFQPGTDPATREAFQRHARGNTLFHNAGDGTFDDVSVEQDVTMGRWAWGSRFVDLDNDGLEDLLVLNGFVTNAIPDDL